MKQFRKFAGVLAAAALGAAAVAAQVTTETVSGVTNFRQVRSTVACAVQRRPNR